MKTMENGYNEYLTFHITTKDGTDGEMAVTDECDFEDKHYVVGALIQDDTIVEDGQYIYQSVIEGDDFKVEKIKKEFDYNRIAKASMEMEE